MNLPTVWKKPLLFGCTGAVGCLAGWLVGEGLLLAARLATGPAAAQAPTLISGPVPVPDQPPPPSLEFQERLDRERAKTGEVQLSLIWFNKNDLDLHCIDPDGFHICFERPRSPSGGELDVDANGPDDRRKPLTSEPVENIYWDKAPPGKYTVFINYYRHRPEERAPNETRYKVSVLYGGRREEFTGTITNNGTTNNPRPILEFQLYPRVEVFAPTVLDLPAAAAARLPVVLRRSYYQGEVRVHAENLPKGVTAEPVVIPEGKSTGEITLTASESAPEIEKPIKIVATGGGLTGSADVRLTIPTPAARFSVTAVVLIAVWTALLAIGLSLALLAGQNRYLGRPLLARGRLPLGGVVAGAALAGVVSGALGQFLFSLLLTAGLGNVGLVVGWVLLGGLLGWGVSYFVPNLDATRAALAGLAGGCLGGGAYLVGSALADPLGRWAAAAALGFCIGVMVAVVEAAFRRAWLEVRFGSRETIRVNLGPEPVKVGGDARACTVWARGAPPVALRFFVRDGRVVCENVPERQETLICDGQTRVVGNVTLTVRTGSLPGVTPPPAGSRPQPPSSGDTPSPPAARPATAPPAAVPPPSSVPDWFDDGSPVPPAPPPSAPPPPARPKVASILDADDEPTPPPPLPSPPTTKVLVSGKPPVSPAPKPPIPSAPKHSGAVASAPPPPARPPVASASPPVLTDAVPVTPAATATPAASTGSTASAAPEKCPTCGRKSPGRPGARYCMICDRTY
jgi:hypothetical protein